MESMRIFIKIINTDLISFYDNWGSERVKEESDYSSGIEMFESCIDVFENSVKENLYDLKTVKNVIGCLIRYITIVPKYNLNPDNLSKLTEAMKKYSTQFTMLSQSGALYQRLKQHYNIDIYQSKTSDSKVLGKLDDCERSASFCFIDSQYGRCFAHKTNFLSIDFWHKKENGKICKFEHSTNEKGLNAVKIEDTN